MMLTITEESLEESSSGSDEESQIEQDIYESTKA
jgi:hypothetical protein